MHRRSRLDFQFDGKFEIPRVRRDASGLAFHPDSGHLWTITDDDVRLVEFTPQGVFVREVQLVGFDDAEGLCHVDGDRFLIAEEKRMRVTLVDVPPGAKKVMCDGKCLVIDVKAKKKKGLEGVSYDASTDTLFTVREGKPPAVFRVHPLLDRDRAITSEWSLDISGFKDLSDTYFEAATGWLWLVSHESQAAAAFDSDGAMVAEVVLQKGHHGLREDVKQAEGIVRDHEGVLYICSEPNHIYRFRPI
jgi:uncharacterized protein YjiK